MTIQLLPEPIRDLYEVYEWKHACAILQADFPNEWQNIVDVLTGLRFRRSDILARGKGNKSDISNWIDSNFYARDWVEKSFDTKMVIDELDIDSPTHKVDCFKNKVAIEIEWNNKDSFYDRDLNNFRLLFDMRTVSVGIIITRSDELQQIFNALGKGKSYGQSTAHMSKLLPKIEGGGGGGCPIIVFGITNRLYIED